MIQTRANAAADAFIRRFSIGSSYRLEVYKRPGRICTDDELATLTDQLRQVAAAGQDGKDVPEYGVLLGTREDLSARVITLALTRAGEPVGFSAMSLLDVPVGLTIQTVLHLGLVFISPEHQRQGLPRLLYGAPGFLLLFEAGLRGFWVSNVSQVPAVIGLAAEAYAQVYPHYDGEHRQTFTHLVLARQIMRHHRSAFGVGPEAGFIGSLQIITNAYTGGSDHLKKTFAEAPKHRNALANTFCEQHLDYRRGDDFLQLGRCTLGSSLAFLSSKLPRGSAGRLVMQAARLLGLAIAVPIVQWLVPPREPALLEDRA